MPNISRRTFLKLATATGASATLLGSGILYQNPSAALAESTSPEEVRYTHCVQCNHGPKCGMKLIIKDGQLYRIEKRGNYNNNLICAKGVAALQEIYDPNRLLYPMKRTNPKGEPGQWERITWDEALKIIAGKLNAIKEKHGAEKVFFITGDPKEPRSALMRLAYTFGSPNFGTESSTCFLATELANKLIYGPYHKVTGKVATGANPVPDKTKVAILWGTNPAWSAPFSIASMRGAKRNGQCKYIVVDPRVTPTVHTLADIHLQIRPGTDGALALCFANALIEAGAYDRDFIEKWAHGFEEYREYCKEFTAEKTAGICGVPQERIQAAIDLLISQGAPIVCKTAAAFPHHVNGVNNFRAMWLLMPLTGSLDVPGGLSLPPEPLDFDMWSGTPAFSRARDLLPQLDDKRADRQYFPVWADMEDYDGGQGNLQLNTLPEYVKNGDVLACVALGTNAMMWPQTAEYQEAFKNLEFMVSADFYIRPKTHDYVDMILPAAMSFERSCPLTVFGRKLFLREPALKPAGEARPDYQICCDIGTALGFEKEFWGGGEKAEENCMREILKTSGCGVSYEDLQAASPEGVAVPLKGEPQIKKYESGYFRKDGQPGFETPTGKVEFTSEILRKYGFDPLPVYKEPTQSPVSTPEVAREYPLILNTGSRLPIFTHSKQRNVPWLRAIMPDPICRLSPKAARERGIENGDEVELSTPFGAIRAKAEVTNIVRDDTIDMFHGWEQANVNLIHARDFDPISGFPSYKEGLCQVKKV